MKNNVTEAVFIIDRSGSMAGLESDTVGGFNSMIEKQKRQGGECFVTTVLFNEKRRRVHDRERLSDVNKMTDEDYVPSGCTALLDAIGETVEHVDFIHRYARPEDIPSKTVFVIMTDGIENASRRFSKDDVRRMIEEHKEKFGWEFLFIGANIDAVQTAGCYGINANRAVDYNADEEGTRIVYESVGDTLWNLRANDMIDDGWCKSIASDHKRRKNKR